jgi:hypothetical protein
MSENWDSKITRYSHKSALENHADTDMNIFAQIEIHSTDTSPHCNYRTVFLQHYRMGDQIKIC